MKLLAVISTTILALMAGASLLIVPKIQFSRTYHLMIPNIRISALAANFAHPRAEMYREALSRSMKTGTMRHGRSESHLQGNKRVLFVFSIMHMLRCPTDGEYSKGH